jgi:archaellum component FlaC
MSHRLIASSNDNPDDIDQVLETDEDRDEDSDQYETENEYVTDSCHAKYKRALNRVYNNYKPDFSMHIHRDLFSTLYTVYSSYTLENCTDENIRMQVEKFKQDVLDLYRYIGKPINDIRETRGLDFYL